MGGFGKWVYREGYDVEISPPEAHCRNQGNGYLLGLLDFFFIEIIGPSLL
jgi:hypothetical protein